MKKYLELNKKHNLPKFDELNRDFEIDKLDKETDFLLKAIRKIIMEKIMENLNKHFEQILPTKEEVESILKQTAGEFIRKVSKLLTRHSSHS